LIRNNPELHFAPTPDPIASREAGDAGLDLSDFSRCYLVNDVRVTFFCPDAPECLVLSRAPTRALRVAAVNEIFA
jgi:hypothetical protein